MKRIVLPGEVVSEQRKKPGSHVFVSNGKIVSDCLGICDEDAGLASVIPLQGCYLPKEHDIIIGIIAEEKFSGFTVDINAFSTSYVPKDFSLEGAKRGTVVSAKVMGINEVNEVEISDLRVLRGGDILTVSAVKVPRIIGKNGSMLAVLKAGTGCNLVVGRNGRIWVKGGNEMLLQKTIKKIEDEAHKSNLTNTIEQFLKEENEKAGNLHVQAPVETPSDEENFGTVE